MFCSTIYRSDLIVLADFSLVNFVFTPNHLFDKYLLKYPSNPEEHFYQVQDEIIAVGKIFFLLRRFEFTLSDQGKEKNFFKFTELTTKLNIVDECNNPMIIFGDHFHPYDDYHIQTYPLPEKYSGSFFFIIKMETKHQNWPTNQNKINFVF